MSNSERGIFVSEELATTVYRGLVTGNENHEDYCSRFLRKGLASRLGIDNTTTSSPEEAVKGTLLVAYVTSSTRLIGLLEGKDPEAIRRRISRQVRVPRGKTAQETFEGLLKVAMKNNQKLNHHGSIYAYPPSVDKSTNSPEDVVMVNLLTAYLITSTGLLGVLEGEDQGTIRNQIFGHLLIRLSRTDQEAFEGLLEVAMENSQRLAFRHHPKPAE